MTVKNIIAIANRLIGLGIAEELINAEQNASTHSAVSGNTTLSRLIECLNYVIDQLACQTAPNVKYQEVDAQDGIVKYEQLEFNPLEVLSLTDSFGSNVPFRYIVGGLMTECSGRLNLTYSTNYDTVNLWSTVNLSNNKLTERTLAYGVCSEYCLLTGDYVNVSIWEQRYNQALNNAMYKRSEKRIKERMWL